MQPQSRAEGPAGLDPAFVRKLRFAVIGLIVLGVAVLVFFLVREVKHGKLAERWDELAKIQDRYEPSDMAQDPLFEGGPDSSFFKRRDDYIAALEAFLPRAESEDDALAPHVHWLIAKLSADQVISQKDEIDPAKRKAYWERARRHMQTILDDYPGFQTNWTMFAPPEQTNLTRAFLATIASNLGWEEEHLPRPKDPEPGTVVVVRTERGDLRFGLYRADAPEITQLFLDRALRGDYDGTAFFAKADRKRGATPLEEAVRAGHPATRGVDPFDRKASAAFAKEENGDLLPAASRYLIPIDRGVVLAWHDPATDYDGDPVFAIAQQRSPFYDYDYSPIGKLLDDASLATLDRIFAGDVWRDDTTADPTAEEDDHEVADFLQAPVRIVKILVFEDGKLLSPEHAGPHKAHVEADEAALSDLDPDGYLKEPPEKPAPPPGEDETEKPGDTEAAPGEGETPPEEAPPGETPPDEDAPEEGDG